MRGFLAYCLLTRSVTLAAICRTKSGLFDAFLCFSSAFWCSLAAGLRDAGMQLCCIDTAQRLSAAAGRTAAEDKGAGRRAPRRRRAQRQAATTKAAGAFLRPRKVGEQGAARKQDQPRGRIVRAQVKPRGAAERPQAGDPLPREGAATDGAAAAQQPRDRPTARRSSPAQAAQSRPQGEGERTKQDTQPDRRH